MIFTFNLNEKLHLPWSIVQMVFCVIWSAFLIITSALVIDTRADSYIAGGVSTDLIYNLYVIINT